MSMSTFIENALYHSSCGHVVVDSTGKVRFVNKVAARAFGCAEGHLINRSWRDLGLSSQLIDDIEAALKGLPSTGSEESRADIVSLDDMRTYECTLSYAWSDGSLESLVITLNDRTEGREAERYSRALNKINSVVSSTLDLDEIMQGLVAESEEAMNTEAVAITLKQDDGWRTVYATGILTGLFSRTFTNEQANTFAILEKDGRPLVIDDVPSDPRSDERIKELGVKSILFVPLKRKGVVFGAIGFDHFTRHHDFSESEVDFASSVAGSASLAIENSRLYQVEKVERVRLQGILDALPVGVFIANAKGALIQKNAATDEIWGGDAPLSHGIEGYEDYKGWWPNGQPLKAEDWPLAKVIQSGEKRVSEVLEIERFDGARRTIISSASPLVDEHGNIHGGVEVTQDITAIKNLERELARSNADLEQFAFIASHDLREPLRMVLGHLSLLQKRSKGKLDEDTQVFISYAMDGAKRMQDMVTDLLAYSRIGSPSLEAGPSSMEEVFRTALDNLERVIKDRSALVTHDPLPDVGADALHMAQLLQNLLENGMKYNRSDQPRVHVSAQRKGSEWLFSVQDNGIGIPKGQQERIFQMFQRLHTRDEYEGTGIGLAIAKKIVERHGGHIWVESEEGKGSTFCFTLPAVAK